MDFINKLLLEWSYRVDNGKPDIHNPKHLKQLVESLNEMKLSESFINEFLSNLLEAPKTKKVNEDDKFEHLSRGVYVLKGKKEDKTAQKFKKLDNGHYTKITQEEADELTKEDKPSNSSDIETNLFKGDPQKGLTDGEYKQLKKNQAPINDVTKIYKELYGEKKNTKLLQHSRTSELALKKGYVRGADFVAPGNASSNFNENMSNEGVLIFEKYPNTDVKTVAKILFNKTSGTKLGNQQNNTIILSGNSKIPSEIPVTERNLYRSCIIAARSALTKNKRIQNSKKIAKTDFGGFNEVETEVYGGTEYDLKTLSKEIKKSNKILLSDSGMGHSYEIPKDVILDWVKNSGSGSNPTDTVVIMKDENNNIIFDGWSDKQSLSDIQSNSSLIKEYSNNSKNINVLTKSNKITKEIAKFGKEIISKYQKEVKKLEESYSDVIYSEGEFLETYKDNDLFRIHNSLEEQELHFIKSKTKNHVDSIRLKLPNNGDYNDILNFLIEGSKNKSLSSNEKIVLNNIMEAERLFYHQNDLPLPSKLDTKQLVSDIRESVLNKQRETYNELNNFTGQTATGKVKKLGDLLGAYESIKALHLDKINEPSDKLDYYQILKRNSNLVMGGINVPPKNIRECIGVMDIADYEDNFELILDERIVKDYATNKYTTGKVVQIYAIDKNGEKKAIAEKRYRSKKGPLGKTDNTIQWSKDMQNCFNSKQ